MNKLPVFAIFNETCLKRICCLNTHYLYTVHLSDTSSIAQHLKIRSCPTSEFRKILTENPMILEQQNNKLL